MRLMIQIFLFGSLPKWLAHPYDPPIQLQLQGPTPLVEVIRDLNIPPDRVQLAMVNYRAVPKDALVHPGNRLALFPKEYPVFADWKNLRF